MRRDVFIEMVSRKIHGGFAPDDSEETDNLINTWIEPALGIAAQANYKNNIALDGIGYVNGSFYSRFKNIAITSEGNFLWKSTLPVVPVGLGANEGISTIELKDDESDQVTRPFLPITEKQRTFYQNQRPIPNKVLYYTEGNFVYIISTLLLTNYTLNVTMVSGGDPTDMDSELNVPPDYLNIMSDWIYKQMMEERLTPKDVTNDGASFIQTT